MDNGVFEVLASEDAAEQERLAGTRAVIAAQTCAKQRFEKYVSAAGNQEERDARIAVISSDLDEVLADISTEYGFEDVDQLRNAATVALGGGHPSGCECGFCKNKGKLPGSKKDDDGDLDDKSDDSDDKKSDDDNDDKSESKKPWESSVKDVRQTVASASEFPWEIVAGTHTADGFSFCGCDCEGCDGSNHCESEKCIETKHSGNPGNPDSAGSSEKKTAADVETGDTFTQERVDLPSSKEGLGGPSPKIDKGESGSNLGWDLEPIDVPSEQHPTEKQQIHDTPDYKADLPGVSDTGKSISADAPLQPEHNVAPRTDTWTGTEEQANPVTSAVRSKWSVLTT